MVGRRVAGMVAAGLLACAGAAAAQQRPPELHYGLAITSNYIDKATTQSHDNPAVQGYVEGSLGMFYGGVWASTVDFPGDEDVGAARHQREAGLVVRRQAQQRGVLDRGRDRLVLGGARHHRDAGHFYFAQKNRGDDDG